ncbi:MAG: efflux RND transporter periplasmic adaptor subunit [Solirubrobacterales bacterium]
MNATKKVLVGILLLCGLGAAALFLVGFLDEPVRGVQVIRGSLNETAEDIGEVQSTDSAEIYALQPARVASVPVSIGDSVAQGQILVTMESLDLEIEKENIRSQLAQANTASRVGQEEMAVTRAELEKAQSDFERSTALYRAGALSGAEYEKSKLQIHSLKSQLGQRNASLKGYQERSASLNGMLQQLSKKTRQLNIVSKRAGTVLSLPAEVEQVVSPGTLLATVGKNDQLEVKAGILEDEMGNVRLGQRALVSSPVLGSKVLMGTVKQIYPKAEPKTSALGVIQRRVPVVIALKDMGNLKPGYEVRVVIQTAQRRKALKLPREAVRTLQDGREQVAIIKNKRVHFQEIQTGIRDAYEVEILKGLKPGETVVRDASRQIREGQSVRVTFE